jgi:deoxyhypusine monooxygenase
MILSGCLSEPSQISREDTSKEESTSFDSSFDANLVIGDMASKGDILGLTSALNDSDKFVRLEAAKALGILMAGSGLKDDPDITLRKFGVYNKAADPSLEVTLQALIYALNDTDEMVRSEAASSLGEIGDRSVVGPLIQALKDPHPLVRANSAHSLGNIGLQRESEYPLRLALKDSNLEVKKSAESALRSMKLEPYPAPNTGTYLIGAREKREYDGYKVDVSNPGPKDAVFELTHPGGVPYIAVFVRSKDSYNILSTQISPGDHLYITTGDEWDNDQLKFTKNVIRTRVW